ncbi:MAG: lipid-transfer protein [Acidimicrobiia bacterium]
MGQSERRAVIVGIGETAYTKRGGTTTSEYQLGLEAILAAIDDAGFQRSDVDGFSIFADERTHPANVAGDLGIPELKFATETMMPGGGGACSAIQEAAMAIEQGYAECVVVYRSLCQGQFQRIGQIMAARIRDADGPTVLDTFSEDEAANGFTLPFGLLGPSLVFALPMQRHMARYGTTSAQLGHVAAAIREHANRNPRAIMYDKPLTVDDHQNSRLVVSPWHLFDCCLETDGACAVVVTTPERAADARKKGATILASVQGVSASHMMGSTAQYSGKYADDFGSGGVLDLASRLWGRAQVSPSDIDVAQFYDNFTGVVLFGIEDFGFCERGESGPFVESGALRLGGSLPSTTAGGNLSESYLQGLTHVIEGVRQLRGESYSQVEGAELCFVNNAPGMPTSALVLAAS